MNRLVLFSKTKIIKMTKQEAIIALSTGKKVRHRYFTSDEFVYVDDRNYLLDERGNVMGKAFWSLREGEVWEDGWSIVNPETSHQ